MPEIIVIDIFVTIAMFFVGIILIIPGMFFQNIIIFDSILLAILIGVSASQGMHIHPAFSLLIGIAVFFLMSWLQNTRIGFWIIGGILSFCWAFIFSFLANDISGGDMIWTCVTLGLGFVIMMGLHGYARNSSV